MASLTPPPNRHRASSTNVRPPLTLSSLGSRRRSNSLLDLPPPTPSPSHTPPQTPPLQLITRDGDTRPLTISIPPSRADSLSSRLSSMLSHLSQLLHLPVQHALPASSPSSSPLSRASSDDSILPIASPTRAVFDDPYSEKRPQRHWIWDGTPSVHAPVLFVLLLFPLSTALVVFCMSTLPITISWPRTLTDLAEVGRQLQEYTQSGSVPLAHVVGVISVTAVWKHAWSIPGSVIWNVLAGALFSPAYATLLLTILTTTGSVLSSLLSAPMAPFLTQVFPKALALTRTALEGDSSSQSSNHPKSSAWVRLSILRLIGIVPWAGINIASGVCGVSLRDCILGSFIGCMPWTAVSCQIGDILQTVASDASSTPRTIQSLLASPDIIMKLVLLSFLSLAPILGRNHLRAWLSSSTSTVPPLDQDPSQTAERLPRWSWVKDLPNRIRRSSHSRTRSLLQKELQALTQEKNERLPL